MEKLEPGPGERFVALLGLGMAALMVGGFLIFFNGLGTIPGQEPSKARSLLYVINAATLTGFELTTSVTEFKPMGQATIFTLILTSSLLSLIVGGWALTRILNMPYSDGQIVLGAFFVYLLMLLGAGMLLGPLGLWPALFQATSALGNAGQTLGRSFVFTNPQVHLVLLPLSIIGGLGVPVLLDISSSVKLGHKLHSHTRTVLMMTGGIYILGMLLITGMEWIGSHEYQWLTGEVVEKPEKHGLPELKTAVIVGSTEAINSRSLGMSFSAFQLLSPASQWVVLLLMFIGGSPGSTSGGIKNTTALVLVRDAWKLWKGEPVGRLFGLAVLWVLTYLVAILITIILLAISQPSMPGERMLFLAVSAITNCGTSHAPLSLTAMGAYTLCVAMLFGRFVPLVILWLAATGKTNRNG